MMSIWRIRTLLLCLLVLIIYADQSNIKIELESQIDTLKQHIQQWSYDHSIQGRLLLANAWLQLGFHLQLKDARYHSGGLWQMEALEAFNKALMIGNGIANEQFLIQTNYYKGLLLKMMGFGDKSIDCYDKVLLLIRHPIDISFVYVGKADALMMIGQLSEALHLYRKALELNPTKLSIYYQLSSVYSELGNLTPSDWNIFLNEMKESLLNKEWNHAKYLKSIELSKDSIFLSPSSSSSSTTTTTTVVEYSSDIYWAMYLAAERAGSIDEAWQYLMEAHHIELDSRQEHFNPSEAIQQLNHVKSIFQSNFWIHGIGHESEVPIFIVGMMRSGSTLLETMLDAHKDIWGMGEDSIFNVNLPQFRDDVVKVTNDSPHGLRILRDVVSKHGNYVEKMMIEKAKTFGTVASSDFKRLVRHVVDKMLFNYRNIGFIHLMYPNAVIIHIIRDPMDTLFSCWKHKFDDPGLVWSLTQEHLVLQYAIYLETMYHFRQVLPNRILDIRYEDLISNPEKILNIIIDRIGLDWDENMLEFHNLNRTVHTHSQSQVRHGLYQGSVGSWRKYATHLQPMITLLQPHLRRLRSIGALPYLKSMNWNLDPTFNYTLSVYQKKEKPNSNTNTTTMSMPMSMSNTVSDMNDIADRSSFDKDMKNLSRSSMIQKDGKKWKNVSSMDSQNTINRTIIHLRNQSIEINVEGHMILSKGDVISINEFGNISVQSPIYIPYHQSLVIHKCNEIQSYYHRSYFQSLYHIFESYILLNKEKINQMKQKIYKYSIHNMKPNDMIIDDNTIMKLLDMISYGYLLLHSNDYTNLSSEGNSKLDVIISLFTYLIDMSYVLFQPCLSVNDFNNRNRNSTNDNINDNITHNMEIKNRYIGYYNIKDRINPIMTQSRKTESTSVLTPLNESNIKAMIDHMAKYIHILHPVKQSIIQSIEQRNYFELLWLGIGSSLNKQHRYDTSLKVLTILLMINPENIEGRKQKVDVLSAIRAYNIAIDDISILIDYYIKQLQQLNHTTENQITTNTMIFTSMLSELYTRRGLNYYQLKRYINAYKDFKQAFTYSQVYSHFLLHSKFISEINSTHVLEMIASFDQKNIQTYQCSQSIALLWNLIGKCEKEFGDWYKANISHSHAIECDSTMKEAYHDRGAALIEASYWEDSIDNFNKAIDIDKNYKQSIGYKALVYHSLGRTAEAITELDTVLRYDSYDLQAQYLRSCYLQSIGKYNDSILSFDRLLSQLSLTITHTRQNDPNQSVNMDVQNRYVTAWFRREVASFQWLYLDEDLYTSYNIDNLIHARIKEGHAEQIRDRDILHVINSELEMISYRKSINNISDRLKKFPDVSQPIPSDQNKIIVCNHQHRSDDTDSIISNTFNPVNLFNLSSPCQPTFCKATWSDSSYLLNVTSPISSWIQLNTPGFLPNIRQHRMFGLSVLELMQSILSHIYSNGSHSYLIHDNSSSKLPIINKQDGILENNVADDSDLGYHVFGWKDLFDIAVKWRAISEANDIVWWIDGIVSPKQSFDKRDRTSSSLSSSSDERIGLNTNMVHGPNKVVRYYSYFNKSFELTKEYILKGYAYNAREGLLRLNEEAKTSVNKSKTLHQLYKSVYSQPIFVIPRIESMLYPGTYLNGTRITLTKSSLPEGYDFSICSASTLDRFLQYESELHFAFQSYLTTLTQYLQHQHENDRLNWNVNENRIQLRDKIVDQSLIIFYYWVNYAPITRGTSATGYAVLYACILSTGYEILNPIPENKQLDWEAILSPSPKEFITIVKPWFYSLMETSLPAEVLIRGYEDVVNITNSIENISGDQMERYHQKCHYRINQVFRTIRSRLRIII